MESTLSLQSNLYPKVTPQGAFYAVSNAAYNASRTLLANILRAPAEDSVTEERLRDWAKTDNNAAALDLLYRLQRLEFLYGEDSPNAAQIGVTEERFGQVLGQLSENGKSLLVDKDGFYFSKAGFNHETAEEVANLASESIRLMEKHSLLVQNNLNIYHSALGVCDPSGKSELTFYPLYIDKTRYILVVSGLPLLNSESFVTLVRSLFAYS